MTIAELRPGGEVEGVFACTRKDRLTARNGAPYLAVELRDRTGAIPGRAFRDADFLAGQFERGDLVSVSGRVERFRDELQVELRSNASLRVWVDGALEASRQFAGGEILGFHGRERVEIDVPDLTSTRVTFRGHPPEKIILTGGEGLEPHLNEMLAQACKLPVVYDDELNTLESMIGQIQSSLNRQPGPAACWTAAIGLSLRGVTPRRRNQKADARGNRAEPAQPAMVPSNRQPAQPAVGRNAPGVAA